ncbi:MAG: methylmalonyl-CoA mutase family protein [Bacteroidota bacterium]
MEKSIQNLFSNFSPVSDKEWEEKVLKDLKGKSLESLNWQLEDGIAIKPYYRQSDLKASDVLSLPTKKGDWLIAENFEVNEGVTGTKTCNKLLISALSGGVEAPVVNIDHVIDRKQFKTLLKGIHAEMITLGFSGLFPEADPIGFLKLIIEEVASSGKPQSKFNGNLQLDPIGFFIENGEWYDNQAADFDHLASAIRLMDQKLRSYKLIQVNMHLMHNQRAEITRELAVAIATGSEYMTQLISRGLTPDHAARRIAFSVSVGNAYFPQMAKIRALKSLWRKVLQAYGCKAVNTTYVRASTSVAQQAEDQYTNMISATSSAMAAVLGGVDSLTVMPSDEAHGNPDDFSRRIARNVQHLLREESHLGKVQNPVEGSYYIEIMTRKLMEVAWEKFQKIEGNGGLLTFLSA